VEAPAKAEELAATAAPEADQDQLVHQDPTEIPATPEDPEPPDNPASLLSPSVLRPHQLHANLAPTVSQDLPDHQDPMDSQAHQDRQEREAETQLQDPQAHLDPLETPEDPDSQEDQDSQALPLRANRPLEHQDLQETPEHQVNQEAQERPEDPDRLAVQDPRDHQDPQAAPEMTVSPDSQVQLASQDPVERRASAPSTAPSTEECSSRTELVVAKHINPHIPPLHSPVPVPTDHDCHEILIPHTCTIVFFSWK